MPDHTAEHQLERICSASEPAREELLTAHG